LYLVTSCHLTQ